MKGLLALLALLFIPKWFWNRSWRRSRPKVALPLRDRKAESQNYVRCKFFILIEWLNDSDTFGNDLSGLRCRLSCRGATGLLCESPLSGQLNTYV
jgi:hypothetical protein